MSFVATPHINSIRTWKYSWLTILRNAVIFRQGIVGYCIFISGLTCVAASPIDFQEALDRELGFAIIKVPNCIHRRGELCNQIDGFLDMLQSFAITGLRHMRDLGPHRGRLTLLPFVRARIDRA